MPDFSNQPFVQQMQAREKIGKTKRCLKQYNADYYKFFEGCFKVISELLEKRNIFSHSKMECDPLEQDKNVLTFNYIEKEWG